MQKVINNKILLTGGHAVTTALATIQEIKKQKPDAKLFWISSNRPIEGKKVSYLESDVFPKYGVESHYISAGRIQRRFSKYTIPSFVKIPIGVVQAFMLIFQIKPKVIISFGGYAGFPSVVAGRFLGIPVVLHEQTVAVGLANKVSGRFASKVALASPSSSKYFDPKRVVITGNPMMSEILEVEEKKSLPKIPTILITGGSRGSQIINNTVEKILPELLKKYKVIHQTGELDYELFLEKSKHLGTQNYEVYATISPTEMGRMYERADLYIGRSGANTVSEILCCKIPSILIPIPWTRFDEQNLNANKAKDAGVATILPESELSPQNLIQSIENLRQNWKRIVANEKQEEYEINEKAAKNLVSVIFSYL